MSVRLQKSRMKDNVGQLLIVGFDGTEMTPRLGSLLMRLQPAGVILFARNIKSAEQTWRLLRDCQKCVSTPLFTCVDLEASRSVMSSRAVSANPRETAAYAREFLAGLRASKVLGCGKHFPGLGEGKLDSHHKLPVIQKPLKRLWAEDLFPYRALRAQLPMVMVSYAAYPAVTRNQTPASLSKVWITDFLRKRIGYRNLVISDDLEMGAVLSAASVGEASVEHIRAGGDLCLVCHREDYIAQAYEELIKTTEREPQFA